MERGVMTLARDFLFAGWKGSEAEMDRYPWTVISGTDMDQAVIKPDNHASLIEGNKGTVYACTKLLGNGVAGTEMRIYKPKGAAQKSYYRVTKVKTVTEPRKSEILNRAAPGSPLSSADDLEEIVGGHRLVDLLWQVNAILDHFGLKFLTSAYISLLGNCYWVLLKDRYKVPSSIWIAPAEYMKVKPDSDTLVSGYVYRHGSVKREFGTDEVVHIKLPAPGAKFQYYGRGDLMGAIDAFELGSYIQRFEKAIFKNNASLGGVLSTDVSHTPDEQRALRAQFEQRYSGPDAAGKWLVMTNVEPKPMAMTPRELAYQGSRKIVKEEIANDFLIPVALLTGQVSTRAALETSLTQMNMFAVKPQCTLITEALNAQLCSLYPDDVVIEFDNPVPEDKEFLLKQQELDLKTGVSTIDEVRKQRGEEPFGDVASEPLVDMSRVPLSMVGMAGQENLARSVAKKIFSRVKGADNG